MSESVSFDRAVEYYDKTRSLPDDATERLVRLAAAELSGRRTLEVGAGTGRITLPLRASRIDVTALDLSGPMLSRLRAKDAERAVPIAQADATKLPFADASFDGAVCVHVLHLIPDWKAAFDEIVRVLEPGGIALVDTGGWHKDARSRLEERFSEAAGIEEPFVGATKAEAVDTHAEERGLTRRMLAPVETSYEISWGEIIQRLRDGLYSFTWHADEATRRRAADEVARWAADELGDLDEPRTLDLLIQWRVYEKPV